MKKPKRHNGGQWTDARKMITLQEAQKYFSYDPITGIIIRTLPTVRKNGRPHSQNIGKPAGKLEFHGYEKVYITIDGSKHTIFAHRLAWLLHYGVPPKNQIDHINGVRCDNRISNLREVTNRQNQMNRHVKVGKNQDLPIGVYRTKRKGRKGVWYAVVAECRGKRRSTYKRNLEDAIACRKAWEEERWEKEKCRIK